MESTGNITLKKKMMYTSKGKMSLHVKEKENN